MHFAFANSDRIDVGRRIVKGMVLKNGMPL